MNNSLKDKIITSINKNDTRSVDEIRSQLNNEQNAIVKQLNDITEPKVREFLIDQYSKIHALSDALYRFKHLSINGLNNDVYKEAQNVNNILADLAENVTYRWVTEPNACESCRAMNGNIYYSAADIPDKPHPNCKCKIEINKQNTSNTFYLNANAYSDKTQPDLNEINKMKSKIDKLDSEAGKQIKQIDELEKLVKEIERKVNMNALPLQERNAFEKVKKIIKKEKEDLTRIKTNNNSFYKVINNLTSFKDKINTIVEDYKEALGKSIQYSAEQYMIHNATKYLIDWVGRKFAKSENMPEAWEIYKVASPNYKYNPEYLQKNAYIYNSIQDINNQKLEKDIRERLSLETRKQDCKVVIFKPDSSLAQAVMRDRDFLSFLLNNLNELKKKKTLPDQKIEFTSGDMYNVFHGALIKNIQLHDNGSITMRIEDLYNFNPNRTSARGRIGERLQNEGKLINFYIIVLIEIKK